jgi:hypothetical protein
MFMLFYTINTIDTRGSLKFVLTAVIISQLILQIIGIAQFTGHNPFQSVIGQKAVIPDYTIDETTGYTLWKEIDELAKQTPPHSLIVNPGNNVYQTVYSFNYLSFYLCVIIPVFVMLCILCANIRQKIGMAVMLLLTFINLCAANASGGFLGLFIAFIAAVITFRKHLRKWRYQLLIVILLSGISVALTNLYMKYTNQETVSKQIGGQISGSVSRDKPKDKIDYFINNKDSIIASVNGSEITIKINNSKSYLIDAITDNKGNQLKLVFSNDMISSGGIAYKSLAISFTDKRFADLAVFIPALTGTLEGKRMCIIKLKNEKKGWPFFVNQDGTYYLTDRGALVTLRKVPHWGFNNRYDFGTGRGYIWSRTFPLMLNTLLLGHGADTFAMYFPQDDFTGLYYDYNWYSETTPIIDKPHNFILLNFVNTGGVSALALIAMICIYIIQSYKIYTKVIFYDLFSKAGSGIYLGIIAFFIAGMVYDTSVNVMPLIYGLLGIGIACNCIIQNRPEVSNLSIYTI